MESCECCQADITGEYHHKLVSGDSQIIVCDYCYQELSTLKKQGNEWVESLTLDGVEYRKEE